MNLSHPPNLHKKGGSQTNIDAFSKSSIASSGSHKVTNIHCLNCGQLGHTSGVCPEKLSVKPPAQIHAMADINEASVTSDESSVIILIQQDTSAQRAPINFDFLLLDNQSTVGLFTNPNHVSNIRPATKSIKVHCNKGTMITDEAGDFGGTKVYLNCDGIVNVQSLYCLGCKYLITYDTQDRGGLFIVTTPRGVVEFRPTNNGLHYVDLSSNLEAAILLVNASHADPQDAPTQDHFVNVNTVHQNL